MVALGHLLTPGTPTYAVLKVGALAGVAGLSFAVRRRAKHTPPRAADDGSEPESVRRSPHPRSQKKKRRRRR
jgi:hypothetical protein